ncbi:MAG: class I SAM-dependent methyltransferase [Bacteroidota bacterium]
MPTATLPENWFESWFDSPYYHILYRHRDTRDAQAFMSRLIDELPLLPKQKVLDLACGKGRHSIYLNERGLDVMGVDLSENNITHAKQFENDRLRFRVHDMREQLKEVSFDVILNLFTSFGYFSTEAENQQSIQAAVNALRPDGVFLLDFLNPDYVIANLQETETKEYEGITFQIQRKIENGFIVKDIRFEDKKEEYHFQERVKAISLAQFKQYFEESGLTIQYVWGDYELSTFSAQSSPRLIVVGKKKA